MPRRPSSPAEGKGEQPHVIHPHALYTAAQVRQLLGLRESSLRTAKREQGLRRANRDYYLGEDLLAWLRAGRCSRNGQDRVEGAPASLDLNNGVQRSTKTPLSVKED
jgi:hypothetical protein